MYPETVTLQNASSSTERKVEETTLATRSTRPARSSGEEYHRLISQVNSEVLFKMQEFSISSE